ncbi:MULTISPECIES: hypothetical protein [Paenibacillus]|uniref:hypothetical protein n=1 Tax=Paenibacillus TaxID=44249 RepID=UPI0022B87476|nr:hypothetical protein [Paenibacillus caseinilyticus]MCZ8519932.1 hypothetical protein [Paenibacillus caseinilyticus]
MLTLFFWPLVILSVLLSLSGLIRRSPALLYTAALCIVPTCLYLAATPRFFAWGLLFPLGYAGAARILRSAAARRVVAVLFVLPVYGLFGWLGYVVTHP